MALVSLFFQKRAMIGVMELDASVSESHKATAKLTENEVESGDKVNDHVTLDPLELSIEGVVSENPISLIGAAFGAAAGLVGASVTNKLGSVVGGAAQVGAASIGGLVSSGLGTGSGDGGPKSRDKEDVHAYLLELRDNRQPITVLTGLKEYKNMIVTSIVVPRNAQTGEILKFSIDLKQVKIVVTTTIEIAMSAVKASADKAKDAGKQAAKKAKEKTGKDSTVLFKAFKFFTG